MAQEFLFNVADRILWKLSSRTLQEVWLFPGIKTELVKIGQSISTAQAGLEGAESGTGNEPYQEWLRHLREAMYDTEDLLDYLSAQSLQRSVMPGNMVSREVRLFFSGSNQLVSGLVIPRIRRLRARLERLATVRQQFDLGELFQGHTGPAEMSFRNLPSHLKQCFVCCSLFPKNQKICVPRLINLWIAQGYVKPSDSDPSQCLEDVGVQLFTVLRGWSFFEEIEEDELGNIVSCRMNESMHDLAITVSGTEFILSSDDGNLIKPETLHAAFSVNPVTPWKFPNCLFRARKLRSFLSTNESQRYLGALNPGCRLEENQLHLIASKFGLLRALDLHSSNITKVPTSIVNLKFLAFLDLSENKKIEVLPDSITRLLLLQILNLDNCEKLRKLPSDTKMLVSLIHLGVENCNALTHMPRGIGRLTSLSTLSRFVLPIDSSISKNGASLGELQNLNGLRGTLRIYNLPHARSAVDEFATANLQAKKDVRTLRLEWSDGAEDPNDYYAADVGDDKPSMETLQPHLGLERLEVKGYRAKEFPSWLSSRTNLVAIVLESCEKCQYLPPLHQLSGLKFLTIQGLTALNYVHDGEIRGVNYKDFFPKLEKLVLSNCPKLVGWWTPAPSTTSPQLELRHLSHLSIMACPKLSSASIPVFPSLKSLTIPVSSMRMIFPTQVSSSSSSSCSVIVLSQLETLDVENIDDGESFPEDLFQNLASLKALRVKKSRRLKRMFRAIRHLRSLTILSIEDCRELDVSDGNAVNDGTQWEGLKSLQSLSIVRITDLESLPDGIQHLTLLQRLEISGCLNLQFLPDWMSTLGLQHLIITLCPHLTPRCQPQGGEDYEKIINISNIIVNREIVRGSLIHEPSDYIFQGRS